MIDLHKLATWLSAIAEAAEEQGLSLPTFTARGMGSAHTVSGADGRFVTFKRRLVAASQADIDGVEWTLWHEPSGLPEPVAAFREPQHPQRENVVATLSLLRGWLVDGWSPEAVRVAVGNHPRGREIEHFPPPVGIDSASPRLR